MERVGGRWEKMEGHCSTGQSPQWDVVPMEEEKKEEEEEEEEKEKKYIFTSATFTYQFIYQLRN